MEFRKFSIERYKGYAEPVVVELAPLTILVGANNSGKTALAQAIQLFAGGLTSTGKDTSEPIPLESGGIFHGETFEDLVTDRTVHGRLRLSASLFDEDGELSLTAAVRNVVTPMRPSERQISAWSLKSVSDSVEVERTGFEGRSPYIVLDSGTKRASRPITWKGLIPREADKLADWIEPRLGALETWATGVRHLQCPRYLLPSPFIAVEHSTVSLGPKGQNTPLALAADDELRELVREWYRKVFGVTIDIAAQGTYFELVTRIPGRDTNVRLVHSGRGLSHVLPVVATALTARKAGSGVERR